MSGATGIFTRRALSARRVSSKAKAQALSARLPAPHVGRCDRTDSHQAGKSAGSPRGDAGPAAARPSSRPPGTPRGQILLRRPSPYRLQETRGHRGRRHPGRPPRLAQGSPALFRCSRRQQPHSPEVARARPAFDDCHLCKRHRSRRTEHRRPDVVVNTGISISV